MAARRYNYSWNASCAASSTLPLIALTSAATIRPEIYHYTLGSDATPASNACKFAWQRHTAAGTPGSSAAAAALQALDPANAGLSLLASIGLAVFSVGPTLTANAFTHQVALNMQATIIVNFNDSQGMIMPATAANGLSLLPEVATASYNCVGTVIWSE